MPRMKRATNEEGRGDGASSSRAPAPKRAREDPMIRRREAINKKRILQERGIDLIALRQTFVPDIIAEFGWEQVAAQQLPYNEQVVREFYAMCSRETFLATGRVALFGQEVVMTPDRINAFFGLPDIPTLADGLPPLPEIEMNTALASALRVNGNPIWGRDGKIKQADMHFNAAFWNVISSHNIQPTRHTSDIAIKRARVVYCLMHGRPFDLGVVIHREIAERSVGAKGILPFPGLITLFCANAGIHGELEHFISADTLLGHLTYNAVISKRRGIQRLTRTGDFRPLLPEPEPEAEEDRAEEATDAVDEFPQDQMFDLERDMPPMAATDRLEPDPTEAGPSQQSVPPTSSPPAQQSLSTELLQQILASVNQMTINQQASDKKLAELEVKMAEQQAAMEQRMADQQAYLEQRMAAHSADITTAITQLQTLQQQQQGHLGNMQRSMRTVETDIGRIHSSGIVMSDRIGAFEFFLDDVRRNGPLTSLYRTRQQRTREAERQRQAAEYAAQQPPIPPHFDPVHMPPPPEDIPDYQPLD